MFNHIVSSLHHRIAIFSAVTLLAGAFICPAASTPDTAGDVKSVVGNSGLKLGQQEMLRQFEAASEQEYTLAGGDEVDIQVPGQPDLQGHHVVGPDGMITLALVGPVKVAGLTREAAGQAIAKAWGQFYSTISVTVQVTKYGSNRIVVVGRVATPGPIYFDRPPTLLEALAKSGAYGTRPPDGATANAVAKTGSQAPMIGRCAIYRGSEQVLWIDMKEMFATGSGIDLHLRRDDVVYVPDEQEDLVSVLGQVEHPGAVRLLPDTKLVDLLAMTGGLTEDAAADKIRVVRPSTGVIQEVALKDLLDPIHAKHTVEISLQRGDVIYVPKSGFGKFGYVLGKFAPAGSLMMFGAVAAGR
jgi:polysaccharide export outer membrane protein